MIFYDEVRENWYIPFVSYILCFQPSCSAALLPCSLFPCYLADLAPAPLLLNPPASCCPAPSFPVAFPLLPCSSVPLLSCPLSPVLLLPTALLPCFPALSPLLSCCPAPYSPAPLLPCSPAPLALLFPCSPAPLFPSFLSWLSLFSCPSFLVLLY